MPNQIQIVRTVAAISFEELMGVLYIQRLRIEYELIIIQRDTIKHLGILTMDPQHLCP